MLGDWRLVLIGEVLNIAPANLIVPAALETTSDKLLMSTGDLTDYKNFGVINPFYKKLELVVESYLGGLDTAKWYAAADPKTGVDKVEVAFLHDREAPYIEQRQGWTVDGTVPNLRPGSNSA